MRILIADDQKSDRDTLKQYIFEYTKQQNIEYVIYEYTSAEALLADFKNTDDRYTIIFLDIYMGSLNGMEAAHQLVNNGFGGSLIFTTTSVDFALESYDVNADGYLKKPYDYAAFVRTFERSKQKWEKNIKSITVLWDRIEFRVQLKHIEYIESGDHCCYIHASNETIKTSKTLSQIEAELSSEPNFIRCGRGFIVNLNAVHNSDDAVLLM